MYSTCLFCHAALGANESIENFPVGQRLAFDAAKGRLWAVCTKCGRWNLSPVDERLDAIEEAERAYRDTKKRVTTDHIGLARLRDGTDLIRIGNPLRPEFAAWRYGDTFGRRKRNRIFVSAATVAGGAVVWGALSTWMGSVTAGASLLPAAFFLSRSARHVVGSKLTRVRVVADDGSIIKISDNSLKHVILDLRKPGEPSEGLFNISVLPNSRARRDAMKSYRVASGKVVSLKTPLERIHGVGAQAALSKILATQNFLSGSNRQIIDATALVETTPHPAHLLQALPLTRYQPWMQRMINVPVQMVALGSLPVTARLALEMSLHEDDERRALAGELKELELRWKQAEEIAAISDSLFLPDTGPDSEQK